jgi:hypothetical protein
VPDALHGRAFAAYSGIRNSAELAAFAAGGLLIAGVGARATVAFAGGLAALVGVAGLFAMLRLLRGWQPTGPVGPAARSVAIRSAQPSG